MKLKVLKRIPRSWHAFGHGADAAITGIVISYQEHKKFLVVGLHLEVVFDLSLAVGYIKTMRLQASRGRLST